MMATYGFIVFILIVVIVRIHLGFFNRRIHLFLICFDVPKLILKIIEFCAHLSVTSV